MKEEPTAIGRRARGLFKNSDKPLNTSSSSPRSIRLPGVWQQARSPHAHPTTVCRSWGLWRHIHDGLPQWITARREQVS
jgi:hypothetical protein